MYYFSQKTFDYIGFIKIIKGEKFYFPKVKKKCKYVEKFKVKQAQGIMEFTEHWASWNSETFQQAYIDECQRNH